MIVENDMNGVPKERTDVKLFGFLHYAPRKLPASLSKLERSRCFRMCIGIVFSLNFLLFWSIPIAFQGFIWKYLIGKYAIAVYKFFDNSQYIRKFAADYIYTNPRHSDFFISSIFLLFSTAFTLAIVVYAQFTYGYLPWYVIVFYNFAWVGCGGRTMGAAYALAHKEGHYRLMYKKWIRESVGNLFENILGPLYGNVPYNFSISHVFIHHRTNGGMGDTFYLWDLDRTKLTDFMLYIYRISHHVTGFSSLRYLEANRQMRKRNTLMYGMNCYVAVAVAIFCASRSLSFLWWVYMQPFVCMTYFLALINYGFHGFLEFDTDGHSKKVVNASTIIDGDDDYFGEDDHMAHHYFPNVYYKDLKKHQLSQLETFTEQKASVFRNLSVLELSTFILFQQWDELVTHYVDYSGKLTKEEIVQLLQRRATTLESSYDDYEKYLEFPTQENKKNVFGAAKMAKLDYCQKLPDEGTQTSSY